MTIVSANGPGFEWDAECDVGSTGPDPDGWMSDGYVPNVRGARMHDDAHHSLSLGTLTSHKGTIEACLVTRIAIQ